MRKFSDLKAVNEMKYGQPLMSENEHMKNQLVAAAGNDQRVLNDLVGCLTEKQMKACFDKLSKNYNFTGKVGQNVVTNTGELAKEEKAKDKKSK